MLDEWQKRFDDLFNLLELTNKQANQGYKIS